MPERAAPLRIFVVGCPRSGTTLLQSMLAAHPAVLAFPETHALWGLRPRNPLLRHAGLRSARAAQTWRTLPALGVAVGPAAPATARGVVRGLVAGLDRATTAAGRHAWSEKTPGHLWAVDLIDSAVPDAQVVHVVRQGVATVASLHAVTHQHPGAWGGPRSAQACLARWQGDLRRTARWAGRPRHTVVGYERLVAEPAAVLAKLVRRLGLSPDSQGVVDRMLADYPRAARAVSGADEPWKGGVPSALANRNEVRNDQLSGAEIELVIRGVGALDEAYATLPFL